VFFFSLSEQSVKRRERADKVARWTREIVESTRPIVDAPPALPVDAPEEAREDHLGLEPMIDDDPLNGIFDPAPTASVVTVYASMIIEETTTTTSMSAITRESSPVTVRSRVPAFLASNAEDDDIVVQSPPSSKRDSPAFDVETRDMASLSTKTSVSSDEFFKRHAVVDNPDAEDLHKQAEARKKRMREEAKERARSQKEETLKVKEKKPKETRTVRLNHTVQLPLMLPSQDRLGLPGVRLGSECNPIAIDDTDSKSVVCTVLPKVDTNDELIVQAMREAGFSDDRIQSVLKTDTSGLNVPSPVSFDDCDVSIWEHFDDNDIDLSNVHVMATFEQMPL
jgi:hypothetical protein